MRLGEAGSDKCNAPSPNLSPKWADELDEDGVPSFSCAIVLSTISGGPHGPVLAQELSAGRAGGHRSVGLSQRWWRCSRRASPSIATHRAYVCMGKAITFGEIDALSQALAAWLQGRGLQKGARVAIMMPNVLQYPVAVAAVLRAGLIAVNVNPLYTRARARASAEGLRRRGDDRAGEFRRDAAAGDRRARAVKHVVVASMGDLLGFPKGLIVNFVVRTVKKMVPACRCPATSAFNAAIAAGRSHGLRAARRSGPTTSRCCNTPAARPASPRARRCCTTPSSPTCCASEAWMQPGLEAQADQRPAHHRLRAAALSRLRLHHLRPARHAHRRAEHPDPQSARHAGHDQGAAPSTSINIFPAVNTLFNGLANQPEFAKLDFSGLLISNGGGMAVQEAVAKKWLASHRLPDRRRLWPERDLAPASPAIRPTSRPTPARSACRCPTSRSRSSTTTARRCRSASRARSPSRARR